MTEDALDILSLDNGKDDDESMDERSDEQMLQTPKGQLESSSDKDVKKGPQAGIPSAIFNITNTIIGGAALALPYAFDASISDEDFLSSTM